jgi:hypothetical protein
MQSVHEIITAFGDGAEHTALQELVANVLSVRASKKQIVVLDEHARQRALSKKMERHQNIPSVA